MANLRSKILFAPMKLRSQPSRLIACMAISGVMSGSFGAADWQATPANAQQQFRHFFNEDYPMFSHIMLGANDVAASRKFYDAVLGALGHEPGTMDDKGRCFYYSKRGVFALSKPIDGQPACNGNGSTVGFSARTPEEADAWHAAGLANGGTACEDPPGVREGSGRKMYLAYLRDPSGNKICALHAMG